jgi:hypothetical protein
MKTFATKEKRSASEVRKIRPYVHHPMGAVQLAQRAEIRRILRSNGAQAKLTIGPSNDKYEQEADRVADDVMRMPDPTLQRQPMEEEEDELRAKFADEHMQRQPMEEEEEEPIQAKPIQRQPENEEEEKLQAKSLNGMVQRQAEVEEEDTLEARKAPAQSSRASGEAESKINSLRRGGQPLSNSVRAYMEPLFGRYFNQVQVHTDAKAATTAKAVNARAFTLGQDIVFGTGEYSPATFAGRKLLAHELTHVVQQKGGNSGPASSSGDNAMPSLQRAIKLRTGATFNALTRRQVLKLWKRIRWKNARIRSRAKAVMLDMHVSADAFYFDTNEELKTEIEKRVNTALLTQHTQDVHKVRGSSSKSFGYPFTGSARLYGPRVNYSARDYWTPGVPDNYAWRSDRRKNARLRALPRSERYQVYGDQAPGYKWTLTTHGKADPHSAIVKLFVAQSKVRHRSLMHCDYMLATVHFRAFMRSTTKVDFKSRVARYGADRIKLTYDMDWAHLRADLPAGGTKPLGSLQLVVPSSERDLVIGDHVTFSNHATYDLINKSVGNAWRLENAVLIYKSSRGADVFLGHGSGRKTDLQMRQKLAKEYNKVARKALRLVRKAENGDVAARAKLKDDFNVRKVGGRYCIIGTGGRVEKELTTIKASDVPGLRDPEDISKMYLVVRPKESMR